MAPSPENNTAPKAPDKVKGGPSASPTTTTTLPQTAPPEKDSAVSGLDDTQLKALLDEAMTYKLPKDRHGKSRLFLNLLNQAEEDDRKARATSASGSELVRYYNTTASRRNRHRREPKSVSETLAQGGSLNNLAKDVLYEVAGPLYRPPKTVSARQRQGGSLPCNVNTGLAHHTNFAAICKKQNEVEDLDEPIDTEDLESQTLSLLEHDSLERDYTSEKRRPLKYTTRVNLEIGASGGGTEEERGVDVDSCYRGMEMVSAGAGANYLSSCNFPMAGTPFYTVPKEKRFDENGNALGQSLDAKKIKKKKNQVDKNVVSVLAAAIAGHRSDIIDDVNKLTKYIYGTDDPSKQRSKKSVTDEKKKRLRAKGKEREKLKKCNSLEAIPTTNRDEFTFGEESTSKGVTLERRERRSWGNSEPLQLYANASAENLETADFRVVTKKKKKRRKRHNSVNGRGESYGRAVQCGQDVEMSRRKAASSVPHSEKSNDSSDADSIHSLPIDTIELNDDHLNLNLPISYADIAKNNNSTINNNLKPRAQIEQLPILPNVPIEQLITPVIQPIIAPQPVDITNIQNWPAIPCNNNRLVTRNNQTNLYRPQLDIPDVQTIEKMHMREVRAQKARGACAYPSTVTPPMRTRPAVVISGVVGRGDVTDLTFGFDINEELLSDTDRGVCETFAARFHPPNIQSNAHHENIVNFVGLAWEDIVNQSNGKVKYFSDQL